MDVELMLSCWHWPCRCWPSGLQCRLRHVGLVIGPADTSNTTIMCHWSVVCIYAALLTVLGLALLMESAPAFWIPAGRRQPAAVLVGLIDDMFQSRVRVRFIAQVSPPRSPPIMGWRDINDFGALVTSDVLVLAPSLCRGRSLPPRA